MRAALLKGGIIWRLALEVLSVDDVLAGPSTETVTNYVVARDGVYAIDDDLSPDEMDIICGVYRISNSKLNWAFPTAVDLQSYAQATGLSTRQLAHGGHVTTSG